MTKALLIGQEPLMPLGFSYVREKPYDAVVIGSLTLGELLRFREERVLAALAGEATGRALPCMTLPLTTLLEVTTGTYQIASLPLPLPLRTALAAGATGMGGMAVLLQNRACYPKGLVSLGEQALWQALHGAASFLLALGLMLLLS